MTRIRSIKPEIVDDAKLAALPRDARLTFVYLITQADNYGYVLAAPRKILGALFPHDTDVTIEKLGDWLTALADIDLIRLRQTRDGTPVVELANWGKHQKLDKRGKDVIGAMLTATVLPSFPFRSQSVPNALPPDLGIKGSREQGTEGALDKNPSTSSPLPDEYALDYEAAMRGSRSPSVLAQNIRTLCAGKVMGAEGSTPEDVGRGLRDLILNGASMAKLTNYVRVARDNRLSGPPPPTERPGESFADLGKRLDQKREEAA